MINKKLIQDIYPLSQMQEGILFHSMQDTSSNAYLGQSSYRIRGSIDTALMVHCLNKLFERHDILRTAFVFEKVERPLQILLSERQVEFHVEDLRTVHDKELKIKAFRDKDIARGFDLTKDVLLRFSLLQLDETEYEFIWTNHHIILDGWSTSNLTSEFYQLYNSPSAEFPANITPYKKYINWLSSRDITAAENYWKAYLNAYSSAIDLSITARTIEKGIDQSLNFEIESSILTNIKSFCIKNQVTLSAAFKAVWGILLSKYSSTADAVFGNVVSGRPSDIEGVDAMIGLFINTIPCRCQYDRETTFIDLLKKIHKDSIQSEAFSYYSIANIQSLSPLKGDLFNSILAFQNFPDIVKQEENKLLLDILNVEEYKPANYELSIIVTCYEKAYISIDYNNARFSQDFIKDLSEQIEKILVEISENPLIKIDTISILPQNQRERILSFNSVSVLKEKELAETLVTGKTKSSLSFKKGESVNISLSDISSNEAAGSDSKLYIVDHHLEILPIGALGSIYIGAAIDSILIENSIADFDTLPDDPFNSGLKLLHTGRTGKWIGQGICSFVSASSDPAATEEEKEQSILVAAPRLEAINQTEERVLEVFKDVLELNNIRITDSFFELGGHSLKIIQIISRVYKLLNVKLEVSTVFEHPTVETLSEFINLRTKDIYNSILPLPLKEYYPVSYAQRRLWTINETFKDKTHYNIQNHFLIKGELDVQAFEKSFDALINRHEILRTTFKIIDGELKQIVNSLKVTFKLAIHDFSDLTVPMDAARLFAANDRLLEFYLETGPLLRASLLKLSEDQWAIVFTLHHIISDGWSFSIIFKEIIQLYNGFKNKSENELTKLDIHYKDYANWHNLEIKGVNAARYSNYWKNNLAGEIPRLDFPADYQRPAVKTNECETLNYGFTKELTEQIRIFNKKNNVSLFMTLISCVKVLLYKYTGQKDIILGTPVAGRDHLNLENQIGFYINTLPLRTTIDPEDTFNVFLNKVKENLLGVYNHQLYPFDLILEDLNIKWDRSHFPLFDIVVVLQNTANSINDPSLVMEGLVVNDLNLTSKNCEVDLRIEFFEGDEGMAVSIDYSTDLFVRSSIENLLSCLEKVLTDATLSVDKIIRDIAYMPETMKQELLSFNDISQRNLSDQTLVELFELQAGQFPEHIALAFENTVLSYAELNKEANKLAHFLRESGIKRNEIVGIYLDKCAFSFIAILGVLKAGAAYLPIDPKYPMERIKHIILDADIKILITHSDFMFNLDFYQGGLFVMDIQADSLEEKQDNPEFINRPTDLAYVIYTSGSTGTPNGVMVEHQSCVNMVLDQIRQFSITEQDKVLQFASLSFDASVSEIFMSLGAGATLVLFNQDIMENTNLLITAMNESNVSVVTFPPAFLSLLDIDKLGFLRAIITAGEPANYEDAMRCLSHGVRYFNAYGPTECSVCTTIYEAGLSGQTNLIVPIGRPILNTEIYILNDELQLLPQGVSGHIFIGGAGIARGYINNDPYTAQKFIASPFNPSKRIYKTGDIGKSDKNGNLIFLGRKDNQVKIRGFRIELGEIENVILKQADIQECVVITDKERSKIIAYVRSEDSEQSAERLRTYIEQQLPDYMVPNHFVFLVAFPVNVHGKIDRSSLPDPITTVKRQVTAPVTATEEKLLIIWKEILGLAEIGTEDGFFELGGQSMKAIQIVSRVFQEMNSKIEIKDIFDLQSIRALGEHMTKSAEKQSWTCYI